MLPEAPDVRTGNRAADWNFVLASACDRVAAGFDVAKLLAVFAKNGRGGGSHPAVFVAGDLCSVARGVAVERKKRGHGTATGVKIPAQFPQAAEGRVRNHPVWLFDADVFTNFLQRS